MPIPSVEANSFSTNMNAEILFVIKGKLNGTVTAVCELLTADKYRWIVTPTVAFLVTRGLLYLTAYLSRVALMGQTGDGPNIRGRGF